MRSRFLIAVSLFAASALILVVAAHHVSAEAPADPKGMSDVLRSGGGPADPPPVAQQVPKAAPPVQAQAPSAPPAPADKGDVADGPFPGPANPLDLEATGDETKRVMARIGKAGGTLKTTGADGATYELTIPPKALGEEVEITMTPIAAVKGLPEELAEGHGVILEPDGLILDEIGLLRVSRPGMVASKDSIALIGEKRGYDSHMTMFRPEPGAMVIAVAHFTIFRSSADDLVKGHRSAERIAERRRRAEQIAPRTTMRRFEHLVAVHLSRDHDRLVRAIETVFSWLVRADVRRGNPDLACPALRQAYRAHVDVIRAARALGHTEIPETPPVAAHQTEYLVDQCRREAETFCRANMDGTRINEQVHAESRAGGGTPEATAAVVRWANDALKRCLPSEVVIRTVGEGKLIGDGCVQDTKLDVEIRFRLGFASSGTLSNWLLTGSGQHVVHTYTHSGHCGARGDRIEAPTASRRQPARVHIVRSGRRPDTPLDVIFWPGSVNLNWTMCHAKYCSAVDDDDWWTETLRSHYRDRLASDGAIRFDLQELSTSGARAEVRFVGQGTTQHNGHQWRGSEVTTVTVLRAQ